MYVKFIHPVQGYAYFEGNVASIPDDKAMELIKAGAVYQVDKNPAAKSDLPEEELDITDDVREEALLLLPMNLLCSPDCRGLCPQCGANLNRETCSCTAEPDQDSPWSALDQLQL